MEYLFYVIHFAAAGLLLNSLPHLITGVMGTPFQSPFSKPPGIGLSSPFANIVWGGANFVVGFLLLSKVGNFSTGNNIDLAFTLAGGWLTAFALARYFTKLKAGELGEPADQP